MPMFVCISVCGSKSSSFVVRLACLIVLESPSACIMTVDVLASADADLRVQMEEAGVSADVQKAIYAEGFTSVLVFAGLEESREGARALKSFFKLDSAESPAMRKEIPLLLAVWEGARSQLTYQAKNKEEAKQGTQNRLMQSSEYCAMRARAEKVLHRTLKDREAPSKALVASKLEQLEEGVPKAEDLRDVTSYEDVEAEAYNAIIDPATAMLRLKHPAARVCYTTGITRRASTSSSSYRPGVGFREDSALHSSLGS